MRLPLIALLALSASSVSVVSAADLDIKSPWVRGTVAGQKATGAFMELTSASGIAIVGASSPVANVTEIHEMKMDGGVMKMRAIPRLDVEVILRFVEQQQIGVFKQHQRQHQARALSAAEHADLEFEILHREPEAMQHALGRVTEGVAATLLKLVL